jgi:ubiquinone/menaquinone biosynthesis C-methylase UbiE
MKGERAFKKILRRVPNDYYQTGNFLQRLWHGKKWQTVRSLMGAKEKRILDVGCASGYSTNQIGQVMPEAKLVGVDIDGEFIRFAREKYPQFRFLVADAENLPFRGKSFDAVVCTEVIEHLAAPEKMVEEVWRVLKPGGKFILEVDTESLLFRTIWFFWIRIGPGKPWKGSHLVQFSVKELERLLLGNRFRIKKKKIFNLGMAVAFLAIKRR